MNIKERELNPNSISLGDFVPPLEKIPNPNWIRITDEKYKDLFESNKNNRILFSELEAKND